MYLVLLLYKAPSSYGRLPHMGILRAQVDALDTAPDGAHVLWKLAARGEQQQEVGEKRLERLRMRCTCVLRVCLPAVERVTWPTQDGRYTIDTLPAHDRA